MLLRPMLYPWGGFALLFSPRGDAVVSRVFVGWALPGVFFTEVARPAARSVGHGNSACFVSRLGNSCCEYSPWVRAGSGCLNLKSFGRMRSAFIPKVNNWLLVA